MFHILTKRIKTIWKIELFHFTLNNYFSYLNHPKRRLTMNFDRFPFLLHSLFRDPHWKWIVQCFQLIFLHLPLFHWLRLKLKKSLLISFEITKITIEKTNHLWKNLSISAYFVSLLLVFPVAFFYMQIQTALFDP